MKNQEFRKELGKIEEESETINRNLEETRQKLEYKENKYYRMERKRNNIILKCFETRYKKQKQKTGHAYWLFYVMTGNDNIYKKMTKNTGK